MKNNFKYRLYGRSKGRNKNNKINEINSKKKINLINKSKYNIIDIGSGYGESSIELAKLDKQNVVIACEKFIDGINNTLNKIQTDSIENLFIFHGNANQFLDENCVDKSISEIWILFPDPWPKKRHFKRRLIDKLFFTKIQKYLKKGSTINIASDSKSYISQILATIHYVKNDFEWLNQSKSEWDYNPKILPETKYFKKALKNGHNPFFAKLEKL